jgi:hypothetical protein
MTELDIIKQQMYEKAGIVPITLPIDNTIHSATAVRELEQARDAAYEQYIEDTWRQSI